MTEKLIELEKALAAGDDARATCIAVELGLEPRDSLVTGCPRMFDNSCQLIDDLLCNFGLYWYLSGRKPNMEYVDILDRTINRARESCEDEMILAVLQERRDRALLERKRARLRGLVRSYVSTADAIERRYLLRDIRFERDTISLLVR